MLFNSYAFILVYLPLVIGVYVLLTRMGKTRHAIAWLSLMSFAFYGYWDVRYVPLLVASMLFNFVVGNAIVRSPRGAVSRKALLWLGVAGDLALLGYFKYAGFFTEVFNSVLATGRPVPEIILPLGISFFTFTQLEFIVDAYRGDSEEYNLLEYSLFVTFFPHLIAGPILRHDDVIDQFRDPNVVRWVDRSFALGFAFFAIGLFKKTLVADNLSAWVGEVFAHTESLSLLDSWAGALAYTFQLYFDFSGYSDMAVGLGWMMNIRLPFNFNSPYKSRSIVEFWRRWHITLSDFLKNYLYIPLGGSRKGSARRSVNLMITMLLGGLWHGAGWTYVIWGGWHGLMLTINHAWRRSKYSMRSWLAWSLAFLGTVLGWAVFRAESTQDAVHIVSAMLGGGGVTLPQAWQGALGGLDGIGVSFGSLVGLADTRIVAKLGVLVALTLAVVFLPNTQEIVDRIEPRPKWVVFVAAVFLVAFLFTNRVSEFLYFQF